MSVTVKPGIYRHVTTNSFYAVLGVATCSTNGPRENTEQSVIYYSLARQKLRYREVSEFLSPGRFELVTGYEECEGSLAPVDEPAELPVFKPLDVGDVVAHVGTGQTGVIRCWGDSGGPVVDFGGTDWRELPVELFRRVT